MNAENTLMFVSFAGMHHLLQPKDRSGTKFKFTASPFDDDATAYRAHPNRLTGMTIHNTHSSGSRASEP